MSTAASGPAGSTSHADASDLKLVAAMAAGDAGALAELYHRHGRAIMAFVLGRIGDELVAEEILQDVMLSAWRSAATFRGESRVQTWLLSIAHHQIVNRLRRHHVATVPLDAPPRSDGTTRNIGGRLASASGRDDGPDAMEGDEIQQAISHLLPDQQVALDLVFFHELSLAEAAEVLGVSIGTVKSRLHRAKVALRRELGDAASDGVAAGDGDATAKGASESGDSRARTRNAEADRRAGIGGDAAAPKRHYRTTRR